MSKETNNNAVERAGAADLAVELNSFIGTSCHYQHWLGVCYTDGVKHLADRAAAHWLIDAIASWQPQAVKVDREFQVWELIVNPDQSALLTFRTDAGVPPAITQKIEYTDFPLPSIEIWVEHGVLLLPSEH